MERTYKLHLPAGLPENAPLVVVLHGYGGNNNPDRFAMNATADRHGFAVATRRAPKTDATKSCWNVGYPFQADMTVDDVRFLTELVRHLQKNARTEPAQRLLHGHVRTAERCVTSWRRSVPACSPPWRRFRD